MSPRPGGEADKFGNRYEGRWTVRQLLYVLLGRADSVIVEEVGEAGEGVEFTVRLGDVTQAHQVKRQRGNRNEWSPQALDAAGVLQASRNHVAQGHEFHFVSMVQARTLQELGDRARTSTNLQQFIDDLLTKELEPEFTYLCGERVFGSPVVAWKTLRSTHIQCIDELDLKDVNSGFAGLLLDGAEPPLSAVGLGDVVVNNLNDKLDAKTIERHLETYGLRRANILGSLSLAQKVATALGQWKDTVSRELLRPVIARKESADIWNLLQTDARILFVIGAAGGGKSAVLHEAVQKAESAAWPVLALRLDRVGSFTSAAGLGNQLGLGTSPVSALAAVSQNSPSLLIIDQLDAVSLASGRMPASFDVVASVLREASGFPNMRVVLACRKFDVDNDERIRAVVKADGVSQIEVAPLSDEQVNGAVEAMELDATTLNRGQRNLLRSPFNLVLLRAIADQGDVLSFATSRDLLDAYWDRKLRNCRKRREPAPTRFNEVIEVIVDAMSKRQRLAVPMTVLDQDDLNDDARVLESEHILVRDGRQYAFFHEEFFGYAFARRWIGRGQTLVEFLRGGEQELFRRGQVREVLSHLHDDEPDRFIEEAEGLLLESNIRFHIKDVVIALIRALPMPTSNEWAMVKRVIEAEPEFIERLWLMLRTLPWFDRLDAEGELERWLRGDEKEQTRALEVALGGIKQRPDRMARLIAPYAGRHDSYAEWLRWVTRFADLHASRELLDLVIDALRRGEYDGQEHGLWISAYNLADNEPTWAVELLSAFLQDQPESFTLDDRSGIKLLRATDHTAIELTTKAAEKAPQIFLDSLLPYAQKVVQLTEYEDHGDRPIRDRQFFYRLNDHIPLYELEEALLHGLRSALRKMVAQDQESARPALDRLAADKHETAQWLLYDALQEAGEYYAEWAAQLLLEGDHRLIGADAACARLLAAIGPNVGPETFARLEQAILGLRVPWEQRPNKGLYTYSLLAELPKSRLSQLARRRLGELERLFSAKRPPARHAITNGGNGSPIPHEAADKMTDEQWLKAMAKYNTDREVWTTTNGGASELSSVLQTATAANPARFARLALRLSPETHPAYAEGILRGLGNAEVACSSDLVFDVVRHIASFGHKESDLWLVWPLRKHLDGHVPDNIIQLLVDRALNSTSPEEDHWQEEHGDTRESDEHILTDGLNSGRGTCALMLGDLLVHDLDGHRTRLITPSLRALAADPSVAVRSCVAHTIAACLRHDLQAALEAFNLLIQTDDRLLATHHAVNLIRYVGSRDPAISKPVVIRMLPSEFAEVRKFGGQFAAFAGLEWGLTNLLKTARVSADSAIRTGVAVVCVQRLPHTSNASLAAATLQQLARDTDEDVRQAVAELAGALRGERLGPFSDVLISVIDSPAFEPAVDQLLITLERAVDQVDDLIMACARRFIATFGTGIGDLSTGAAGNAKEVGQLVLRAYEQARTKALRSDVLDLIDKLLLFAAYGVEELVDAAGS
jgi:hypothetical protein